MAETQGSTIVTVCIQQRIEKRIKPHLDIHFEPVVAAQCHLKLHVHYADPRSLCAADHILSHKVWPVSFYVIILKETLTCRQTDRQTVMFTYWVPSLAQEKYFTFVFPAGTNQAPYLPRTAWR